MRWHLLGIILLRSISAGPKMSVIYYDGISPIRHCSRHCSEFRSSHLDPSILGAPWRLRIETDFGPPRELKPNRAMTSRASQMAFLIGSAHYTCRALRGKCAKDVGLLRLR
ncbi:uncharacterized protein F4807DRAFT_149047 [Annulohypoxylon truncatum]|uniref:uncharacterized protein n=1 Tax=Annulohypoxylon truncatum TaxID=327061 RepID=UPI002008EB91|nr:uncharacterized protein F4807DRAFT_149047 [Annulohypoxylon truncatum]KAI1208361.1 hypothetical protein F4807DRAFT_149047 [Annulohypoxylon truncatum]